jgi:hydroxyacylglutathione hydrolase
MLVRRFYDDRLAQASYMIGCQKTGEAIVIDPARDIRQYIDAARQEGVRITHVTETHIHADFLSGTRELAAATGAEMLLSGEGGEDWQYGFGGDGGAHSRAGAHSHAPLLRDGDVITLGNVRIDVMHTPGHTPEHLSFVVTDGARSNDPVGMVSGDFIFVGDVGRPDLLETAAGVVGAKDVSARALFKSLQRLDHLPDYLQIWPGHGAGSACGKALGSLTSTTLGYERRTNWAFQERNEAAFVAAVLEGQPSTPRYFGMMKRLNREGPPVLGNPAELPALSPNHVAAATHGSVILDIRPFRAYAAGHISPSLNIPVIKAFTKWAGWLLAYDRDLYLIAPDAAAASEARRALQSIGLDRVRGAFGPDAIVAAETAGTVRRNKSAPIGDSPAMQRAGTTIIDVRENDEWTAGHIDGAMHFPLGRIPTTMEAMDRDTPLAVHCEGGTRSAIAVALLEQMGFSNVTDMPGGWNEWKKGEKT